MEELEQQFEQEDYAKDLNNLQISQRRKFLNDRITKRKNLYIYPVKVNV